MPIREIISSYGQPIVMGLTPYTRTTLKIHELRSDWPPTRDEERLSVYSAYTALIENRPSDIFDDLRAREDQASKIMLAVALPELLCNVWADAVWSDPPTIELPSSTLDDRWAAIDTANDFSEIGGWESVFSTAAWGTSVLRLRRDEERMKQFDSDVVIEEIDPAIYFPILKRGSARDVEAVVLAWEEDRSDPDSETADWWQVRQVHDVQNGQYTIDRMERKRGGPFSRDDWRRVGPPEQPDGVDFLPFVDMHAKRWRGRFWGVSELNRIVSIVDEIDNTLSNIAEILEYHGKPMLQVPASVIYGGTLLKGADRVMGLRRPEDKDIARYITYDGQIDAQLADLDRLLELALLTCEVPRTYFGMGDAMAAPSGTSLKLQLQNYLKKAGRWQRAESMRDRTLIPMALRLDGKAGATKLSQIMPQITHGSALPADEEQEARIEQGLYGAGMSSLELSIRKLRRVPADEIDKEIAAIEKEKEASIAALPAPLASNAGGFGAPNSSTDPNAQDRKKPPVA